MRIMTKLKDFNIKVISSNIRNKNVLLADFDVEEGRGQEGDIVLLNVLSNYGAYTEVQNQDGWLVRLFKGDYFISVLGNRESSTFLVGGIPDEGIEIKRGLILSTLSGAAIIGECYNVPEYIERKALSVEVVGLVQKNGKNINIKDFAPQWINSLPKTPPQVVILGTSSETGKTILSTKLIDLFKKKYSLKVASAKISGTGFLKDILKHRNAGATPGLDFVDIGLVSTYTKSERYIPAIKTLLAEISKNNPDLLVIESGGDIIWANVPTYLQDSEITKNIAAFIIAPNDILGVLGVLHFLEKWELTKIPVFVSMPLRNNLGSKLRLKKLTGICGFDVSNDQDCENLVTQLFEIVVKRGKT